VRGLLGSIAAVILLGTSCGGSDEYAGLTRSQAIGLAKARIEAGLEPTKRSYYETSIWNTAAQHGRTEANAPVWLIGIWNGQADRGDCALVRRENRTNRVQLVPCGAFPKYAR
jgi:hypothetical protein